MTRDMDLVRALLLKVADLHLPFGDVPSFQWDDPWFKVQGYDQDTVIYNFEMLVRAGFIDSPPGANGATSYAFTGLTWSGAELLDAIRNPTVWELTKEGGKKVGGLSFDLMVELAKGYGKMLIEQRLGIKL